MGAAAQLPRVVPDLHDPDPVAVLLAEQRQRAHRPGLVDRGLERPDLQVVDEDLVDLVLRLLEHRGRHRPDGGEVEPEPARRVLRARLGRGVAERAAERAVHQVRGGVRAGDRAAPLDVDLGAHRRPDDQLAGRHHGPVHDQPRQRGLHVLHLDHGARARAAAGGGQRAGVRELPAALGVERGPVQHHVDPAARARRGHRDPVGEQPDDRGVARHLVVPGEGDPAGRFQDLGEGRDVGVAGLLARRVGLGPVALLGHQAAEPRLVDGQPLLGGHLQGQVDREAVGVVELERLAAADGLAAAALGLLHRGLEDRGAGAQRGQERRLLGVDDGVDLRRVAHQVVVLLAERADRDGGQLVHVALVRAAAAHAAARAAALRAGQQPQVADGAAQDPAQHIAAALVGGGDAVGDEHDRRAHVVGHHAQRHVGARVPAVLLLGQFGRPVEHLPHGVDLVDVVDALEQDGHPLQAHAGVDVLGGSRR